MIDDATKRYLSLLAEAGINGDPCDEWEVQDLEQQLRVTLPPAFRAFLMLAGKWFEPFVGSHYLLGHDGGELQEDPAELQRAGQSIPKRDGNALPDDAFVFFVQQGVAAIFFLLDEGDDPPVYEYVEHEPAAKRIASTLSEFLSVALREWKS